MEKLLQLPNIGKTIEKKLNEAGIHTKDDLLKTGSQDAFIKIKLKDPTVCINMLYALEGAVQGIHWHEIEASKKQELKIFFENL